MLRSETNTEFENSATRCSAGHSLAHVVFEKPKKQKKTIDKYFQQVPFGGLFEK